jgi:putative ABC transport system ATP-binding protein
MTEALALAPVGGLLAAVPLLAATGHRLVRVLVLVVVAAVVLGLVTLVTVLTVRRLRRRRPASGAETAADRDSEPAPAPEPGVAIFVQHLKKTYRMGRVDVRALDDVSLEIPDGAMVCIMGKSGSGKSTLLRQLGLIDRPTDGRVRLHGEDVTALSERERTELRLSRLGYVFQEYALLPELTARENVYLPAMMLGKPLQECRRRAAELLEIVGLADRSAHRPKELSGGEQQRVAIARALVNEPRVIYADEPTANLDSAAARTVMETLQRLNDAFHVTVLFVSHDPDDARYATRLIHLKDGRISEAPA